MDESQLHARAVSAYFRTVAREGAVPQQPVGSPEVLTLDGKAYVVLRNVRGVLAVYRVRNDGMLKRLRRWPADIE